MMSGRGPEGEGGKARIVDETQIWKSEKSTVLDKECDSLFRSHKGRPPVDQGQPCSDGERVSKLTKSGLHEKKHLKE